MKKERKTWWEIEIDRRKESKNTEKSEKRNKWRERERETYK